MARWRKGPWRGRRQSSEARIAGDAISALHAAVTPRAGDRPPRRCRSCLRPRPRPRPTTPLVTRTRRGPTVRVASTPGRAADRPHHHSPTDRQPQRVATRDGDREPNRAAHGEMAAVGVELDLQRVDVGGRRSMTARRRAHDEHDHDARGQARGTHVGARTSGHGRMLSCARIGAANEEGASDCRWVARQEGHDGEDHRNRRRLLQEQR
jgi:hypothetical protein